MNSIVFMRGAPGSGKSTFIEQNGLKQFAISADDIRLLLSSPVLQSNGKYGLIQKKNKEVFELLLHILEEKMSVGEFIVIDTTLVVNNYKKLIDKYHYRAHVVDLSGVSLEQCLLNNKKRKDPYKIISDYAVENIYNSLKEQPVPKWLKPGLPSLQPEIVSNKHLVIIGDIHGCYSALKELMDTQDLENTFFVYVGDYLDRGIENEEVLEFIMNDSKNSNFLRGNHEIHLHNWAYNETVVSEEFLQSTLPQIQHMDKNKVKIFLRSLQNVGWYKFGSKEILVTHGGISRMPENLLHISNNTFIKGTGSYEGMYETDTNFAENSPGTLSIHGHRNIEDAPIRVTANCFNLEGKVEFGGYLRAVKFTLGDEDNPVLIEIKNKVCRKKEINLLEELRSNKDVKEVSFPNTTISSFSFSRNAFYHRRWNKTTIKARSLFIDLEQKKIIARGYEKFFNVGERIKYSDLKSVLKFPVATFQKENGYLGLISSYHGELLFCSKSSINTPYAINFEKLFKNLFPDILEALKEFVVSQNVSLLFEVIDPVFDDTHILKSEVQKIIFLDAIKNSPEFFKVNFNALEEISNLFKFQLKTRLPDIENWEDFEIFVSRENSGLSHAEKYIEGYVFEDSINFMLKLKTPYYNFWKAVRRSVDRINDGKDADLGLYENPLSRDFIQWFLELPENVRQTTSIPVLRNNYKETMGSTLQIYRDVFWYK